MFQFQLHEGLSALQLSDISRAGLVLSNLLGTRSIMWPIGFRFLIEYEGVIVFKILISWMVLLPAMLNLVRYVGYVKLCCNFQVMKEYSTEDRSEAS